MLPRSIRRCENSALRGPWFATTSPVLRPHLVLYRHRTKEAAMRCDAMLREVVPRRSSQPALLFSNYCRGVNPKKHAVSILRRPVLLRRLRKGGRGDQPVPVWSRSRARSRVPRSAPPYRGRLSAPHLTRPLNGSSQKPWKSRPGTSHCTYIRKVHSMVYEVCVSPLRPSVRAAGQVLMSHSCRTTSRTKAHVFPESRKRITTYVIGNYLKIKRP